MEKFEIEFYKKEKVFNISYILDIYNKKNKYEVKYECKFSKKKFQKECPDLSTNGLKKLTHHFINLMNKQRIDWVLNRTAFQLKLPYYFGTNKFVIITEFYKIKDTRKKEDKKKDTNVYYYEKEDKNIVKTLDFIFGTNLEKSFPDHKDIHEKNISLNYEITEKDVDKLKKKSLFDEKNDPFEIKINRSQYMPLGVSSEIKGLLDSSSGSSTNSPINSP